MASTLKIRTRLTGGATGAPTGLAAAEPAYSEVDRILYVGESPTGIPRAIGGEGAFLTLGSSQSISGQKTFTASPLVPTAAPGDNSTKAASTAFVASLAASLGAGDMLKSVYDGNNNGVVDNSERLGGVLASAFATLASPTLSGSPTAPTPLTSATSTEIATAAFVRAFIASLAGASTGLATLDATSKVPASQLPAYVDDVLEFANLAGFPGSGETGKIYVALDTNKTYRWSGTVYTAIAAGDVNTVFGRSGIIVAQNGDYNTSQITNTSTVAGATLLDALNSIQGLAIALKSMAFQEANAVAITGGTIDNVVLGGGSF
jgi:hypothetical protein